VSGFVLSPVAVASEGKDVHAGSRFEASAGPTEVPEVAATKATHAAEESATHQTPFKLSNSLLKDIITF
jgi:hypothetical protein